MTAEPFYSDDMVQLFHGDCLELLANLPDASVDAVVTDPPYGLGFMGKAWDSTFVPGDSPMRRSAALDAVNAGASRQGGRQRAGEDYAKRQARDARACGEWCEQWAAECLRVLKPGGHLLAFGGTRTYHRIACAVEDVGFEVRDSISWLYGSGFPKSLDVSKALDKAAGHVGEVIGTETVDVGMQSGHMHTGRSRVLAEREVRARSESADVWRGWGTALKPAHEPIVVARKSCAGTVAANVAEHGTGALNIDACRVATTEPGGRPHISGDGGGDSVNCYGNGLHGSRNLGTFTEGRWPSNVLLDESQAAELDRQTGTLTSGYMKPETDRTTRQGAAYGEFSARTATETYGDTGGASRFFPTFRYEAKAPTDERPRVGDVAHPTVKPLELMRWLVRLVTLPGGTVLEPFAGSGTTAEACVIEGFHCIAFEREAAYLPLIVARLSKPIQPDMFGASA